MMKEKSWVVHIEEEINNLVDLDPRDRVRSSMFRVPPSIRRVKPHLYSPQLIPFGLYSIERIRNEKISPMDRLKLEVASTVLKIIKAPYTECCQLYDSALDCLSLPIVTPNQLHPILSDLVASLSRLPYVSRDSEGKLEMMRARIAGLEAMAQAPGYELREREARLLSADVDSCFKVFVGFLDKNRSDNDKKSWKWLCNKVVGDLPVMDLYEDISDMYDGAARSILTLDAIFLLGFMLFLHVDSSPECKIQIEELGWFNPVLHVFRKEEVRCSIHVIAFDMWLMENQIPLTMIRRALDCMWEVSNQAGSSLDAEKVLNILVRHSVKRVLHLVPGDCTKHTTSIEAVRISECKHLLEFLYRVVCPSVKSRSSGSQLKNSRRHRHPTRESSHLSTAELAARSRGDAKRKMKSTTRSRSSSSLDVSSAARYPDPPAGVVVDSGPSSSSDASRAKSGSDQTIQVPSPSSLPTYPLFLPPYSLEPPTTSSNAFPGFCCSPPSSRGKRESSSPAPHHQQFEQTSFPLKPLPEPSITMPSNASGYYKIEPRIQGGLRNGKQLEVRDGGTHGNHEPPPTTRTSSGIGWNSSPVNTDDEVETPFRWVPRSSSPLPVSDTMGMEEEEEVGLDHVQYTQTDQRFQRNSYSTVTIDIPQIPASRWRPAGGAQSNSPISDSSALNNLWTASMKTVRSVQSAGNRVGSAWRLCQKIFGHRGVGFERKISSVGKGAGAAAFGDRGSRGATEMAETRILPVSSVTELRKVGIRCRSGSQVGCKPLLGEGEGFGAFRPTLFLPKLLIDENTERILQNLVAFELVTASEHELMSFLHFMTDLVKTEQDVQTLKQGEKAVLWLISPVNDFDVITMFSSLLQYCHFTETNRSRELRKELTHCYTRSWRHTFHTVSTTVCSKSGILILLVAATFFLVALQTVYLLLGYYSV